MSSNPFDADYVEPAPTPKPNPAKSAGVKIHGELIQGSEEWHAARCGLLTASEMKHIITPTLKVANNDKTRLHMWELLAQRITGYVEPSYISDDMLRGHEDEVDACILYGKHYAPVDNVGFITNDKWGFSIGYSPDGLIGSDGLVECKSRRQKFQIQTIASDEVPDDYMIQLQTGLLVSEREWIDYISYSGGLPMYVKRVLPNAEMQAAIIAAATAFEERLAEAEQDYRASLATRKLIPTERRVEQEMYIGEAA